MHFDTPNISTQKTERWVEHFARFGIVSKGVVYCLIGFLTVLAALGLKAKSADKKEAFNVIYDQPLGKILLLIVAIGLVGYVMWRFFQSVRDIDNKGHNAKGTFIRIGYGVSAILYFSLAIYAFKLALQGPGGSDDNSQQFVVAKILSYPAGEWIIGVAGALTLLNGIRQIVKGARAKFMKTVKLIQSPRASLYKKTGIIGYISRGIVLCIIGYFFLRAALHKNGMEAGDTEGAFDFLENNFGTVLMGTIALGLFLYGIFMFVKARYQKIDLNF
jgi:uncharacterized membrane protein YidH (DUF202 family)